MTFFFSENITWRVKVQQLILFQAVKLQILVRLISTQGSLFLST